jgi:hypothetical protein
MPEWKPAQVKLRELKPAWIRTAARIRCVCLFLTVRQPALRDVIQKYFERKSVPKLPVQ